MSSARLCFSGQTAKLWWIALLAKEPLSRYLPCPSFFLCRRGGPLAR